MDADLDLLLIAVFCTADDLLPKRPENARRRWSTRSMAAEGGLNQTAVSRIWRAFGLQPHRQETWKLSKDPLFVEKCVVVVIDLACVEVGSGGSPGGATGAADLGARREQTHHHEHYEVQAAPRAGRRP